MQTIHTKAGFKVLRESLGLYQSDVAEAAGVDVKTVSSILGHTNAAMTLNVYASADPAAKRAAAEAIGEVMGRRPEKTGEVVRFRMAR